LCDRGSGAGIHCLKIEYDVRFMDSMYEHPLLAWAYAAYPRSSL